MKDEEEKLIVKISRYFHSRGICHSSRKQTTPKDEGIDEDTLIEMLNIGVEYSTGRLFVRAKFRTKKNYFQVPIREDHYDDWAKRVKSLMLESIAPLDDEASIEESELDF